VDRCFDWVERSEETIQEFCTILAAEFGLQNDFLLASQTQYLQPRENTELNSHWIVMDITRMLHQLQGMNEKPCP
jgi:hypothetical protein